MEFTKNFRCQIVFFTWGASCKKCYMRTQPFCFRNASVNSCGCVVGCSIWCKCLKKIMTLTNKNKAICKLHALHCQATNETQQKMLSVFKISSINHLQYDIYVTYYTHKKYIYMNSSTPKCNYANENKYTCS